jgi:hypothetical protein
MVGCGYFMVVETGRVRFYDTWENALIARNIEWSDGYKAAIYKDTQVNRTKAKAWAKIFGNVTLYFD